MQADLTTDRFCHKAHNEDMAKLDKDPEFAERFRQLVIEKGWSDLNRIQLGKKIGTSGTCATYYMNGDRLPSIEQSRNICMIFGGICVEWLLTGRGSKYPNQESNLQNYINVTGLTDAQRAAVAQTIDLFLKSNPENKIENAPPTPEIKPLTSQSPNAGGGGGLMTSTSSGDKRSHNNRLKTGGT
ncbi:helix-turn-helix domain-containing protein [Methylobacter sp. S3L5C]|uniref:helix-turn-helix domain-containing protein n=1 Tax=Methylobacter sp. S3L5C TaxID=2839024 RepID=UPI001FAB684F|nr:helix-turn-helix domain-containing protein [Methylobacter sp. S3L5C]UOA08349.1 helix-turn-helix domain-containing protein [Methylobacter sp. S3L5C]